MGNAARYRRATTIGAALLATAVFALGTATAAVADPGHGQGGPAINRPFKGPKNQAPLPLVDHGGPLLATSTTYAIFWGPAGDFPPDLTTGVPQLLRGFAASSYLATARQYMRGAGVATTYGGAFTDSSAPPSHSPSTGTIVAEVAQVLGTRAPDPHAVYLVYTSNFPHLNFCAWHGAGTINGVTVQVAYLPNTAGVAGCDPGNQYDGTGYSEGTRSVADSTAHEFMESVTDPVPASGWADKTGEEIGDKCNFVYGGPVTLSDGAVWQLQEEWSNAAGGCVQTS